MLVVITRQDNEDTLGLQPGSTHVYGARLLLHIFGAIKVPLFCFSGTFPIILKQRREHYDREKYVEPVTAEALKACQASEQGLTTEQAEKIRLEKGENVLLEEKKKVLFRSF